MENFKCNNWQVMIAREVEYFKKFEFEVLLAMEHFPTEI